MSSIRTNRALRISCLVLICAGVVYLIIWRLTVSPIAKFDAGELLNEYGEGVGVLKDAEVETPENILSKVVKMESVVAAADAKYRDKLIEVSGIVHGMGFDSENRHYVELRSKHDPRPAFTVMCFFSANTKKTDAKLGDLASIRGICMGRVGNVLLSDCILMSAH
jgi:hypothetical protein